MGWAHSSDLADPTPFLEVDNLLLTTGTQFAADAPASAYDDYVGRLVTVGVAALGFGTEVVRVTPEPLVATCVAQDLPLLEVPYRTPFLALARRIADARAEQDHARDLWALDAQRALSLAALSAERIAGVLEVLAQSTARRRLCCCSMPAVSCCPSTADPTSPMPRPRPCRPRRDGCCTAGCGPDRLSTCRVGPVSPGG